MKLNQMIGVADPFNISMCPTDAPNWTSLVPPSSNFTQPTCGMSTFMKVYETGGGGRVWGSGLSVHC